MSVATVVLAILTGLVLLLPTVILLFAVVRLWPVVTVILGRLDVLEAKAPSAAEPLPPFLRVDEEPLPTGQAQADFWRRIHALPEWKVLSWFHQAEARTYLAAAKTAAEAGNDTGAIFAAGKAHEAAFWAVRPEFKLQQAMSRQREERRQAEEQSAMSGGRPGTRWHEGKEQAGNGGA